MEMALFYFLILLLFSFAAMYFSFAPQVKIFEKSGNFTFFMQPILYIFIIYAFGTISAYYLGENNDFIAKPDILRVVLPLVCTIFIYVAGLFFGEKAKAFVLLLSIIGCVFLQPLEAKFVPFGINEYLFKILAVIFFFVFCFYYKILNILPHTIFVVSTTMLIGVSLLSFVGGAPLYLAYVCALLIGSLCGFLGVNLHSLKIELDNLSCSILAFLICNIFILNISELSFSSCIIFTMLFWAELALSIYNKFFVNEKGNLLENSHLLAVAQKLTLNTLVSNLFKIGLVCMFFGWFQLFSINQYSLPIISFFIVIWLDNSMGANLLRTPKSLKQINSEFVADIKQNLKDTKESFSQIKNKKDN